MLEERGREGESSAPPPSPPLASWQRTSSLTATAFSPILPADQVVVVVRGEETFTYEVLKILGFLEPPVTVPITQPISTIVTFLATLLAGHHLWMVPEEGNRREGRSGAISLGIGSEGGREAVGISELAIDWK